MKPLALLAVSAFLLVGVCYILPDVFQLFCLRRRLNFEFEEMKAGRFPSSVPRQQSQHEISFDSVGFAVTDVRLRENSSLRMSWPQVHRVTAFKRDLWAVDCICLLVEDADGMAIELNEEMEGWRTLCEALPRFLERCLPVAEWIGTVSTPAFARNWTELYSRAPTVFLPVE